MMAYNVEGILLDRPFRIRRIGHFGHHTHDISATVDFTASKLGLLPSDQHDFHRRFPELGKTDATGWFFRCASDHHCLVVASHKLLATMEPARTGEIVNQLSWQIGSLQEVVDAIEYLDKNAKLRRVGRDAPGSNYHAYAYDPDGYVNEVYYGMEQIGWDGCSKPDTMYHQALKTCPELPRQPEYLEVDDSHTRNEHLNGFRWRESRPASYPVAGILMPQPFKLTHLGRITLFVSDLPTSLDFYCNVMGLKVTERLKVRGHECAYLRADNEHHTLALYPNALRDILGFSASYGMAVATYEQLKAARRFLQEQGLRILNVPAELSPGVRYGFWVQGPDPVAVHIYYGMDRIGRDGIAPQPTTLPLSASDWPETIVHGGPAWYDPAFLGPWA
ncbi:VOC family protein [Noviherbaspirillum saxi]|uniref:VOC domain-containing protein n=1 Tax=Noviherbaspirillum saxi TaxID=2320863 RepID=A0A3A3FM61_9BURK|nr:VOC family protein [Noviherbaspirillum saxi]RJF95575.1 hypothetical protein D3871_19475 [Noviherbaspirillum saxi]